MKINYMISKKLNITKTYCSKFFGTETTLVLCLIDTRSKHTVHNGFKTSLLWGFQTTNCDFILENARTPKLSEHDSYII